MSRFHMPISRWLSVLAVLFMVTTAVSQIRADTTPEPRPHGQAQPAMMRQPATHEEKDKAPHGDEGEKGHKEEAAPPAAGSGEQRRDAHGEDGHAKESRGLEHLHFPVPPPYRKVQPPDSLWTDPQVLARGEKTYTQFCAVCHGVKGDGRSPAAAALALPPSDFTESQAIAEMPPDFWFWKVSEGNTAGPYKAFNSAMPPWKSILSEEDRWAVIAYMHLFSGHRGPHTLREHPGATQAENHGAMLYNMACTWCHGKAGKGDGPAAFFIGAYSSPRPRDFTRGEFKFRSTPTGEPPTDDDLYRSITRGIPGYMPSFATISDLERWMLTLYIKRFMPAPGPDAVQTINIPTPPARTDESVKKGFLLYQQAECWTCHGFLGEGDGPNAATLKDADGLPITAANLRRPSTFKNGKLPEDIYRTLMTGLSGTPMPSYADAFEGQQEDVWHLVNYVRWLSKE